MDCVWPRKNLNDEFDNDVIEPVSDSSDSDVILCLPTPDSLAPGDLLTHSGCMCVPCGAQRFVSKFEEGFCYASSTENSLKNRKEMLQQQRRFPLVKGSGMSAPER